MKYTTKYKDKTKKKMRFIFRALQDGYSVKKNDDDTYTFTIDRSKDEPLSTFVNRCTSIQMCDFQVSVNQKFSKYIFMS